MKSWQYGYDIDYLKGIEIQYQEYNGHSLSPFSKYKKNDIAKDLHEHKLHLEFYGNWVENISKVKTPITLFQNIVIGEKQPKDVILTKIVSGPYIGKITDHYWENNVWVYLWADDREQNRNIQKEGFQYVSSKVTTFGEIFCIYFRNKNGGINLFGPESDRIHPKIDILEYIPCKKLLDIDPRFIQQIETALNSLHLPFTNHYSNYNKDKSWSAISLRGYSSDWKFICKPEEMSKKWQAKHKNEKYFLQDTDLYRYFLDLKKHLTKTFETDNIHRIRFMKLSPGNGELERHTDQVDPDCGKQIGKLLRIHIPIITNDKVEFTTWDQFGKENVVNMKLGECWFLDTRWPHKVINGGTTPRIHLVVDLEINQKIRSLMKI